MTKRAIGTVFLVLSSSALTLPAYAGVYKWVDEKGNVHYSEQPPKTGGHTQVRAQPALGDPQPKAGGHTQPASGASQPGSENKFVSQLRQMEAEKSERERIQGEKQRLETERQIRERDREMSDPKYWERERQRRADEKKARDDATVADCKSKREVYCDQGAERIHRETQMRALENE